MRTIVQTYSDDLYIIEGKTPAEIRQICSENEWVIMPNKDEIRPANIRSIQSYESYTFQKEQKRRHRIGHYIKNNEWYDDRGKLGISAHLERITGEMLALGDGKTEIKRIQGKA